MKNELLSELDKNSEELFRLLPSFSHETFNTVPFPGSWTAGQVAKHLSMSETGAAGVLFGNTRPTERPADQQVQDIRNIFLNFDTKMKSPPSIDPRNEEYRQEKLIAAFQASRQKIRQAIEELDLTETVIDFEFPKLGFLTRLEMINFAIAHSIRHTRQLKNIAEKVSS